MKVGSLVEVIADFSHLEQEWVDYFTFPKRGDTLTIKSIKPHHKFKNLNLLTFEEGYHELCDKTVYGKWNFKEVLPPLNINKLFEYGSYRSTESTSAYKTRSEL